MSVASPPPRARGPSDADLDLSALGSTLWRKKWTVLRPTILVAVATFLVVQVITPRYQSEARIFIESRDNIYLRPDVDKDITQNPVDDEAVTSQVQIILSRDLAREVIKKLKLNEKPEFDPALNGVSPIKAVLGLIGVGKDPLNMTPEERVLNSYYDRLTVTPVDKSRVINIDFLSQDPELAAQVANAIADGYLMRQREAKEEQAKTAAQWLSGEIETMRQKVEQAEAKVEDFPRQVQSVGRQQQHHAVGADVGRRQCPACCGALAKGRRRGEGQDDPRHAALRPADRNPPISSIPSSSAGWRSSASPCARNWPSNRRRSLITIRGSSNSKRRSPISTIRSEPRRKSSRAHSRTMPSLPARGSIR